MTRKWSWLIGGLVGTLSAVGLLVLPARTGTLAASAQPAKAEPAKAEPVSTSDPLAEVRSALADRDFARAALLLEGHQLRRDAPADEVSYLRGHALLLAGKTDEAIQWLQGFAAAHPNSVWRRKAAFRAADALLSKTPPDYAAAAGLLDREVSALMSDARKAEVSGIYLRFADEAFRPTAKTAAGKPVSPRWEEAIKFYTAALGVGLPEPELQRARYAIGVCQLRLNQHKAAITTLSNFLKEYPVEQSYYRPEAHYLLGEAYFNAGDLELARNTWRDFAASEIPLERKVWRPDIEPMPVTDLKALAMYRVAFTYNLDDHQRYADHVRALAEFAASYPNHPLVPQSRYERALAAVRTGRNQEAAKELADFVAEREAARPVAESDRYREMDQLIAEQRGEASAPTTRIRYLTPEARWQLGKALAAQKQYAAATEVWQTFLARHPSDALWTTVQQAIVDAEFSAASDLASEKKPDAARAAWERFIARYPLDTRVPGLYFTFGQMNFAADKYAEALADWRLLVGKFPQTEEASKAQYRIGLTLETKLDKPADAVEEYRKLNWGSWAERACQRLSLITRRELTLSTERTFRSDETPKVKIFTRNLDKLHVRVYTLDLAAYFRKSQTVLGVEFLDLGLIEPTEKFTHHVRNYAPLKPIEDTLDVPMNGVGAAVVSVGTDDLQSTTLVIRSDLDVLIKASREELLVFAQNMKTGQPMADAEVLIGDGAEIVVAGRTGRDGVLRWSDKRLATADAALGVFANAAGHMAGNALNLRGLAPTSRLTAQAHISTDRPTYRPGQDVHYRAVVREIRDGAFAFTAGESWTCDVLDPAGRLIRSDSRKLSNFGTLAGSVLLSESAPLGDYRIVVRKGDAVRFTGGFRVERYRLPQVYLKFELPETVYFRGETVRGKLVARYYYGEPYANKVVRYALGDDRQRTATTDARGEVSFEIDTKQYAETATIQLTALVPEENVSTRERVMVSTRGFSMDLSTVRSVYVTDEMFDVTVKTTDIKGEPLSQAVTVSLLRNLPQGRGEIVVARKQAVTDAQGTTRVSLSAPTGGSHTIRVEGTDRFGYLVSAQRTVTISGDDDRTKLRILSDTQTFRVGETREIRVHSRLPKSLALVTYEADGILGYELTELLPGINTLRLKVEHRHFPNFAVAVAVMDGKSRQLYLARFEFDVERELRISLKPAVTVATPGQAVDLELRVTDHSGRPVAAEVMLSLTDAAITSLYRDRMGALAATFRGQRRSIYTRINSSVLFNYAPATVPVARLLRPAIGITDSDKLIAALQMELSRELRGQAGELRSRADITRLRHFDLAATQNSVYYLWANARKSNRNPTQVDNWFALTSTDGELSTQVLQEFVDLDDTVVAGLETLALNVDLDDLPEEAAEDRLKPAEKAENWSALPRRQHRAIAAASEQLRDQIAQLRELLRKAELETSADTEQGEDEDRLITRLSQELNSERNRSIKRAKISSLADEFDETEKSPAGNNFLGIEDASSKTSKNGSAPPVNAPVPLPGGAVPVGGRPDRTEFPETAYWNPAVVTDASGQAKLTLELPGNITRWTLRAEGVDTAATVGEARTEIIARKSFFVELRTPVVLQAGDKLAVSARVHHLLALPVGAPARKAELTLLIEQDGKRSEQTQTVELTGPDILEVEFPSFTTSAGSTTVKLSATAGDLRDAVTRVLPVQSTGIRFVASDSATTQTSATTLLSLPPGREYRNRTLSVVVGPSVVRTLVDMALNVEPRLVAVRRPVGGPGGEALGTELIRIPADGPSSAAGDLLAVVFVAQYLANMPDAGGPDRLAVEARLEQLVAGLVVAQNHDGGWSWCGANQPSEPLITARVMWALAAARTAGHRVEDHTLRAGTEYLERIFAATPENDHTVKAVLLHALSEVDRATGSAKLTERFAQANRLYRLRNDLQTAALAHLSLTLSNLDRKAIASEINNAISSRKRTAGGPGDVPGIDPVRVYWPADSTTKGEGITCHAYLAADVEVTALALLAIQRVSPRDPIVEPGVRWLAGQRRGLRCRPDKATGLVVASLGTFHSVTKPAAERYRLSVRVNGREIGSADVAPAAERRSLAFTAPAAALADGVNKVELVLDGRAEYTWSATLSGFADADDVDLSGNRLAVHRSYEPPALEHDGRPLPRGFSILNGKYETWTNPLTQLPAGKRAEVHLWAIRHATELHTEDPDYLVLAESIPAGCAVVADSIRGNFDRFELGDGEITFFLGRMTNYFDIRYTLVGILPGEFTAGQPVISSLYRPALMCVGSKAKMTVLPRGTPSADPYRISPDELYHLGKALFDAGRFADAAAQLTPLFNGYNTPTMHLTDGVYRDTARMLLRCAVEARNNDAIVRFFEVLKERYPNLVIPTDQALIIGRAYRAKGEHERGLLVFRATADAGFVTDAKAAEVLAGAGQFEASVAFLRELLTSYPDSAVTRSSRLALSQLVYAASREPNKYADLAARKATKAELLRWSIRLAEEFLSLYPDHPAADEAGFTIATALLELERFGDAAGLAEAMIRRYPESTLLDGVLYLRAYCRYALGDYDAAMADAKRVAEEKFRRPGGGTALSDNRFLATYILGQIYHSRNMPAEAIRFYEPVADHFTDARDAVADFQRKELSFAEIATFTPRKPAAEPGSGDVPFRPALPDASHTPHVALSYRNIAEADIKVYCVDLVKLYLQHRNLSRITAVNLTGITPTLERLERLGEGRDYADRSRTIWLPELAERPGAYLVVIRGDSLYRSGLVLVSRLTLTVTEDEVSGRVRSSVRMADDGGFLPKVKIRTIGEGNRKPVAGETDLRGLFLADNIKGRVTVLASDDAGHYAFYRGRTSLQNWSPPEEGQKFTHGSMKSSDLSAQSNDPRKREARKDAGYLDNLNSAQTANVHRNLGLLKEAVFDQKPGGIQVQQAR